MPALCPRSCWSFFGSLCWGAFHSIRLKMRLHIFEGSLFLLVAILLDGVRTAGNSGQNDSPEYRLFPSSNQQQSRTYASLFYSPTSDSSAGSTQYGSSETIPSTQQVQTARLHPISRPQQSNALPSDKELFDTVEQQGTSEPDQRHSPSFYERKSQPQRYEIAQFVASDGGVYGPYTLGGDRFQTKAYPLDIPLLSSLYQHGRWRPIMFERYYWQGMFLPQSLYYRPDPVLLKRLQERIEMQFFSHGWRLEPVDTKEGGVWQGEFLWPPVRPRTFKTGVQISLRAKEQMAGAAVWESSQHKLGVPRVWTITLPAGGRQSERHIMMSSVDPARFTDLDKFNGKSDFWLFHEAMTDVLDARNRPRMILLGGMFLPKGAVGFLQQHGYIRPAFSRTFGRPL